MKKIQSILKVSFLVAVLQFSYNASQAQILGGPGTLNGTPTPSDNTPATVPFDGGLSLILLAAGSVFGAKKVKVANTNE